MSIKKEKHSPKFIKGTMVYDHRRIRQFRPIFICFAPSGNPANAHTIVAGERAVQAHMAHGDTGGPCPASKQGMLLYLVRNYHRLIVLKMLLALSSLLLSCCLICFSRTYHCLINWYSCLFNGIG